MQSLSVIQRKNTNCKHALLVLIIKSIALRTTEAECVPPCGQCGYCKTDRCQCHALCFYDTKENPQCRLNIVSVILIATFGGLILIVTAISLYTCLRLRRRNQAEHERGELVPEFQGDLEKVFVSAK
ncbi:hypothetical protein D915_008262 [Fasciola hepatica]|uniref:Uncharacterized protein n=1 Tax=Fasciola hepatica TaxID=6192 RepID=A0A4E0R186_FASHE|nr:hypothetical protein D915_008262 [Fasciola hepatica]